MEDLGLLLALVGFDTRMVDPDRWPLELRDNLLTNCEAAICLVQLSWTGSGCAYWVGMVVG